MPPLLSVPWVLPPLCGWAQRNLRCLGNAGRCLQYVLASSLSLFLYPTISRRPPHLIICNSPSFAFCLVQLLVLRRRKSSRSGEGRDKTSSAYSDWGCSYAPIGSSLPDSVLCFGIPVCSVGDDCFPLINTPLYEPGSLVGGGHRAVKDRPSASQLADCQTEVTHLRKRRI